MINIRSEFNDKVTHIDLYYDLLNELINNQAFLSNSSNQQKHLSPDLIKVLKANVFLLLYNLLESTIRKTVEQIHIVLNGDAILYIQVNIEIRKIWIEFNYNNFKDSGSEQIFNCFENIASDLIYVDYEDYINKRKSNDISGNVDARKVRYLSEKYSFDFNKRVEGRNLVIIKNRRNNLAHGNITFAECGKDYTYNDLLKLKKETILFLNEFLNKVEKYLTEKKYRK